MTYTVGQYDIFDYFNPMNLDHAELHEHYVYDRNFGFFYKKGDKTPLGHWNPDGYVKIPIFKKGYLAHRLAWFYVYKKWPIFNVDHKNRIRFDNRIENLRDVPQRKNAVPRAATADKKGPFNPNGKKHYELMLELVAKRQRIITFS